ncbi:MAG: CehA/McbA family metallohydrolase [Planctomycetota bacterium]
MSIHEGKKQRMVACYSRGTGTVEVPLPAGVQSGLVTAVKGFEHLPIERSFAVRSGTATVTLRLQRWSDLRDRGWLPAEEHLHYDRLDAAHDADWLTLLAGDDLAHAHFLVLKGGNLPGIWARQFAYGAAGEATDGRRLIRPGEEYRDGIQGHINLLGVNEVIPPISTGGIGQPKVVFHYPAFYDVLQRARSLDGIVGPAHGTALGRSPTGIVDTVLGAVDFFEIANTHLYKIDVWYQLMNCGYVVPPAAGTDLPNFPFRETWQPLLGETRMYVRVGEDRSFDSWKRAVCRGEVFVTSGPLIRLQVNNGGPGSSVKLPPGGGDVHITVELAGPRPLNALEAVKNGKVVGTRVSKQFDGRTHRWRIDQDLRIDRSCWLAARGVGAPKRALEEHTGIVQNATAHTSAIRVLVGDQPITSRAEAESLRETLKQQRAFYQASGQYELPEHRHRVLDLFDAAIAELDGGKPR